MTMKELATLIGVKTSQISNIENDYNYPSAITLLKLMMILDLKASELYKHYYITKKLH